MEIFNDFRQDPPPLDSKGHEKFPLFSCPGQLNRWHCEWVKLLMLATMTTAQSASFWLPSGYLLTTFWLHSDYISATFWLHSDYILARFLLHFDYIPATFRLHFDYILTTFWLHSDYILTTFWPHSGYILITYRLHSISSIGDIVSQSVTN